MQWTHGILGRDIFEYTVKCGVSIYMVLANPINVWLAGYQLEKLGNYTDLSGFVATWRMSRLRWARLGWAHFWPENHLGFACVCVCVCVRACVCRKGEEESKGVASVLTEKAYKKGKRRTWCLPMFLQKSQSRSCMSTLCRYVIHYLHLEYLHLNIMSYTSFT